MVHKNRGSQSWRFRPCCGSWSWGSQVNSKNVEIYLYNRASVFKLTCFHGNCIRRNQSCFHDNRLRCTKTTYLNTTSSCFVLSLCRLQQKTNQNRHWVSFKNFLKLILFLNPKMCFLTSGSCLCLFVYLSLCCLTVLLFSVKPSCCSWVKLTLEVSGRFDPRAAGWFSSFWCFPVCSRLLEKVQFF